MKSFKKLGVLLVCFGLFLLPTAVYAHSVLLQAVPGDGDTAEEQVTELVLSFNTIIEQEAEVTVLNEAGERFAPESLSVSGNELVAAWEVALPNGSYTVQWRVIGEDGHEIEGTYAFAVAMAEAAPEQGEGALAPDGAAEGTGNDGSSSGTEGVAAPGTTNDAANGGDSAAPDADAAGAAEDGAVADEVGAVDDATAVAGETHESTASFFSRPASWAMLAGFAICLVLAVYMVRAMRKS